MKNFLRVAALAICTLIVTANANAQVITADRAQEIASSFFQSGMQKSAAARSAAASELTTSLDSSVLPEASSSEEPTFHIITPASGKGFVIVAGEEMENPIIGYSMDGTIDANDLPVGFVDYMTDIDAQVKALRKYNAENPKKASAARKARKKAMQKTNYAATTMGNIVVQIETAKWGQNTPFNDQCWTDATQTTHAKTGCVPTAFAIIARHHQWPLEGIGTLYNQQTGVVFSDRSYDYSKMPLEYDSNWTDEQKAEVAKLMAHMGHAFGVTWGSGQTSVSIGNTMTERMTMYFNYSANSVSDQYDNGTLYNFDTWTSNLKSSLNNNCPVPYAANNSGTGDTRHMFVVDGYTNNDYFHFNFGWNGGSNGWFTLKAITPSQGDNYSWDDSDEGYNSKHQAFFNLEPNKTKYTVNASVSPTDAGTVSINGGTAASTATGEFLENATITLTATSANEELYTFENWTKGGVEVSTAKSFSVNVTEAADYVANFLAVSATDQVNISITNNAGGIVRINGVETNSATVAQNSEVTVTAEPSNGYIFSNWTDGGESIATTEYTFVAKSDKELTATFAVAPYYTITAEATTGGTATVNGGSTYSGQQNTTATLQATPDDGYYFINWTVNGTEVSTESTLEISIQGDKTYTANFANTQVTIKQSGSGGHMYIGTGTSVNTNTEVSTRSRTVNAGEKIYLRVEPVDKDFGYWRIGSSNGSIVTNDNPYFFTAKESTTFHLTCVETGTDLNVAVSATATAGGSATITIDDNAVTTAPLGEEVTLTATPNAGYRFVNWTVNSTEISTEATCTAIVQEATTYTANFEVIEGGATTTQYTITASASPATAGTVTGGGTYNENAAVTLTATANNGYIFVNWTKNGEQVSTNATYSFNATAYAVYVANFETQAATTYTITATANPAEGGSVTGAGTYTEGATVTLTATPNSGYTFKDWTSGTNTVSTNATYSFTANATANTDFVANFEEEAQAATEYPTATGTTATNRYLTSATSTGADTNISYTADAHPGTVAVSVPGTIQVEAGASFTLNLVAKSLGAGSTSFSDDDIRYCHASLFTDFDQDFTFQASPVQTWGVLSPSGTNPYSGGNSHIYGNYDLVMNIAATVSVPDDAPTGTSRIRVMYTDAWGGYPTNGSSAVSSGIVYDFTVEVVEKVDITANAGEGGSVTINGEATSTKRVIKGSSVTVNATPSTGYSFLNWSDSEGVVSETAEYTFPANSATTLTANFAINSYTIAVTPEEGGTATTSAATANHDSEVTLTAHPNADYEFAGWYNGEDLVSEDNPFTFAVTSNISYTAKFNKSLVIDLSGRYFRLKQKDTSVYMNISDNTNNDGSTSGVTVASKTINKDAQIFYFIKSNDGYKLQARTGYYITCHDWNANATSNSDGTELTFESTGNELEYFIKWDNKTMNGTVERDDYFKVENSYIYCDAPSTAAATWVLEEVTLCTVTATASPAAGGTVTPETQTVEQGTSVTLSATAADGYDFVNWTKNGNDAGSTTSITVTVDADAEYIANFQAQAVTYTVTTTASPSEGGTVTGGGTYNDGETVTLTATANEGYTFKDWTSGKTTVSTDATYSFTANATANTDFVANFEKKQQGGTDVYNIVTNDSTGDATENNGGSYNKVWTSNNSPKIILTSPDYTIYEGTEELRLRAATYTLSLDNSVDEDLQIVSYTINYEKGRTNYSITLSATGEDDQTPGETIELQSFVVDSFDPTRSTTFTLKTGGTSETIWVRSIDVTIRSSVQQYTVTTTANPTDGGTVTGGGTYNDGETATLTATPNANYSFVNWTKDGEEVNTNTTFTTTVNADAEYVANFNYTGSYVEIAATVSTIGGGEGGTVTGTGNIIPGKTATLTAVANTGYRFKAWYNKNGEEISTEETYEFTADTDATYHAEFIKQVYVEIIQPDMINDQGEPDNGYGFAYTSIGGGTNYYTTVDYGTEVALNVTVYPEFNGQVTFAYWSRNGEKVSQENPYTFTATEDSYSFLANFDYKAYVAVEAGDGNGAVSIDGESESTAMVAVNNTVTIVAEANSGYTLDRWVKVNKDNTETTVSTTATYTFVFKAAFDETVTYKAYFREITELEDGKAYRIKARMSDGTTYRYIYRDETGIKWNESGDFTNNSIFIAQYDFKANDGSLNLISAVGDLGWNYEGTLGKTYVALKTEDGIADGTFTLYNIETVGTGKSYCSYTAYSSSTDATSGNIGVYTYSTGAHKVVDTNGSTDFVFEEVPFKFNVTTADGSNAKLGTVNLPFATTVHPSITVYEATSREDNWVHVAPLALDKDILPANTPVLVEADEAGTYGFVPAPASNTVYETGFAGTLAKKEIPTTENAYILSYDGAGTDIKFYKLSSNATSRTINANKAYYIDETGNAATLSFKFVNTTDIEESEDERAEMKVIYDLQGRKLSEIKEPGIYIINGKKILVK